ncbi:MAG: hypothetical protein AAFX06_32890 [Planctomycetota bacterium]
MHASLQITKHFVKNLCLYGCIFVYAIVLMFFPPSIFVLLSYFFVQWVREQRQEIRYREEAEIKEGLQFAEVDYSLVTIACNAAAAGGAQQ